MATNKDKNFSFNIIFDDMPLIFSRFIEPNIQFTVNVSIDNGEISKMQLIKGLNTLVCYYNDLCREFLCKCCESDNITFSKLNKDEYERLLAICESNCVRLGKPFADMGEKIGSIQRFPTGTETIIGIDNINNINIVEDSEYFYGEENLIGIEFGEDRHFYDEENDKFDYEIIYNKETSQIVDMYRNYSEAGLPAQFTEEQIKQIIEKCKEIQPEVFKESEQINEDRLND